jgi:hypothetical protein
MGLNLAYALAVWDETWQVSLPMDRLRNHVGGRVCMHALHKRAQRGGIQFGTLPLETHPMHRLMPSHQPRAAVTGPTALGTYTTPKQAQPSGAAR